MTRIKLTALLASALMLTAPAYAQGTDNPITGANVTAPEGFSAIGDYSILTREELVGVPLQGPDLAQVGVITDVEVDGGGIVTALIAEVGATDIHRVRLDFNQVGVFRDMGGQIAVVGTHNEAALRALPVHL